MKTCSASVLPVKKALTETGSTGCRSTPRWYLPFIEVLHAFWFILEHTDPSLENFHNTHMSMPGSNIPLKVFQLDWDTDTNLKAFHNICKSREEEREKSAQRYQGFHPGFNLWCQGF